MDTLLHWAMFAMFLAFLVYFGGCLLNLVIMVVVGAIGGLVLAGGWLWKKAKDLLAWIERSLNT